jgi:hypothetical protein
MATPNPYERINARLDDESARRLDELTTGTGKSVSLVVREAIAAYHAQVIQPRRPSRFLAMAGKFASGRSDLSSRVKEEVTEILEEKLRRRGHGAGAAILRRPRGDHR